MGKQWIIRNAKIIRGDEILQDFTLVCDDGNITQIVPQDACTEMDGYQIYDAKGKYLSAGFVDTHVHGGGGADFMDSEADTYQKCIYTHMRHGTTSIMPTTLAAETEKHLLTVLWIINFLRLHSLISRKNLIPKMPHTLNIPANVCRKHWKASMSMAT